MQILKPYFIFAAQMADSLSKTSLFNIDEKCSEKFSQSSLAWHHSRSGPDL